MKRDERGGAPFQDTRFQTQPMAPRPSSLNQPLAAMQTLRFATTNAGKLREAEAILGCPVEGLALELDEIQSRSLREVVLHKTEAAFRAVEQPVLVEDTALEFSAWAGMPGPFIRFFLEALGAAGLAGVLAPLGNSAASAVSGVGYHDGEVCHYFEGRLEGRIVAPRGEGGFGWDSIFEPEGAGATFAEMPPEQKNAHSMRGKALRALKEFLDANQG